MNHGPLGNRPSGLQAQWIQAQHVNCCNSTTQQLVQISQKLAVLVVNSHWFRLVNLSRIIVFYSTQRSELLGTNYLPSQPETDMAAVASEVQKNCTYITWNTHHKCDHESNHSGECKWIAYDILHFYPQWEHSDMWTYQSANRSTTPPCINLFLVSHATAELVCQGKTGRWIMAWLWNAGSFTFSNTKLAFFAIKKIGNRKTLAPGLAERKQQMFFQAIWYLSRLGVLE